MVSKELLCNFETGQTGLIPFPGVKLLQSNEITLATELTSHFPEGDLLVRDLAKFKRTHYKLYHADRSTANGPGSGQQ